MKRWWLSYADDEGFRGVVIVKASHFLEAAQVSKTLGLSPGGECQGIEIPDEIKVDEKWVEKLLTKEECEQLDQEMEG